MSVLVAGDTHGDLAHVGYLLTEAVRKGCTRIVQVGDFGFGWDLDRPAADRFPARVDALAGAAGVQWFWLDGNHEHHDALEDAVDTEAIEPQRMFANVWFLPRGCTWTWEGCRFMALGGAHSIDKHLRLEGRSWWPQELLTAGQVQRAMDRGPVDVLLSHDAPDGACPILLDDMEGDAPGRGNRRAVSAVVAAVAPRLIVHGHYHHRYSTVLGDAQVEGLDRDGTGLRSWITLDPASWVRS